MSSFSQNKTGGNWQPYLEQIKENALQSPVTNVFSPSMTNQLRSGNKLSVAQLLTPDSLKKILQLNKANTAGSPTVKKIKSHRVQDANPCADTSFIRLISNYTSWIYVQKIVTTADGGMLIMGSIYNTELLNFQQRSYGLLIKVDDGGNVTWMKEFDNDSVTPYSNFFLYNAFELANADIVCVASLDTTQNLGKSNIIVYRLDASGNIIWHTDLHTGLIKADLGVSINIKSVAEGLRGDLILCGTTASDEQPGKYQTIIRLDNLGKLVWDANYGNYGTYQPGAEGLAVYIQNNQILEVGLSHGNLRTATSGAVNFLTLDYATGNLLTKRFFRPDYTDNNVALSKNFSFFANECTRLNNGHFVVYGKLFSDYLNTAKVIDHYGVIEFDISTNLVDAYTISSSLHTNYNNNLLYFDNRGRGLISLFEYKSSLSASLYFGAFEKKQFLNQRKADYANAGLPGNSGFSYSRDNGYIFAQSYFAGGTKSAIDFRKMHSTDPSSKCLGAGIFLMQFVPYNIIEDATYSSLDPNKPNQVKAVKYRFVQNDTLATQAANPCKQVNNCDTLKIHGNPVICGSQPAITFTAYKNPLCGGIVQWNIDTTDISKIVIKNDTTVQIFFNSSNWQGTLYASLPTGKCDAPLTDSIQVSVVRSQAVLNLGPDTVLCNNVSLVLHAGNGFTKYLWNDGSTDSVLTVSTAGKYYVTTADGCGNSYADTINVTSATIAFNIGADTMRCNNDTIHLAAPDGFTNYKWQPLYNISSDTGRFVNVLPLINTAYTVTAQRGAGCLVSDTININVASSAPIHLGNDTSLCAGQSLTLNAGAGFSSYAWSTGEATQQVTVNRQGIYIVKATAANSCSSYDTLQVTNIGQLADFTLGNDTTLCNNTIYTYQFNLLNATYLWSDGSTGSGYSINRPGTYSLTVTQQGCSAADTVVISYKNNPSVALGRDTALCAGGTYLLVASYNNATYAWQDGSTENTYLVNKAGNYFVAVNLNGCIARDTINVNYLNKPFFTLGRDTSICKSQTLILQPLLNVPVSYLWQDGSTQPGFTVKDTGLYVLHVSNTCGNFTDSVSVSLGICNLMLPTSFSPNGDGLNDVFRVRFPFTTKEFRMTIFNRYGEKIFETSDMGKGWDGTFNGSKQPMGSYIWVIQMKSTSGLDQSSKGTVTLVK